MSELQKLTVLKIGGKVLDNENELSKIVAAFSQIENKKILIHGGGKKVDSVLEKLGIEKKYINGRRVTDEKTLDVVTMVLSGLVNTQIVAMLQQNETNAIGLTGADLNLIQCRKRKVKDFDYGFAGDIDKVAIHQLIYFLNQNIVPVFCPITHNKEGQLLNTNADTIAQAIAVNVAQSSLFEVELVYCFELEGVYEDISNSETLIKILNYQSYLEYKKSGAITDGMLPKLDNCFNALMEGVSQVIISNVSQIENYFNKRNSRVTQITLE